MGKRKESRSGLGRAIKNTGNQPRTRKQHQERHSIEMGQGKGSNLASVIERNALDEFVATAMMEQRDFAAERGAVTIINDGSDSIRNTVVHPELYDYASILIPRRPSWDASTTRDELESAEKLAFLDWRRELALASQASNLAVTPYEKNLEVWRQLWRVMERSDLVVQIVDARNPLLFYCKDLKVANQLNDLKRYLLVVNKADFLSDYMRHCWSDHFTKHNINFVFFSAKEATIVQHLERSQVSSQGDGADSDTMESDSELGDSKFDHASALVDDADDADTDVCDPASLGLAAVDLDAESGDCADIDIDVKLEQSDVAALEPNATTVLNTRQLMCRFLQTFWGRDDVSSLERSIVVGLVGYPNVGKSSIINALMDEKKVGVAAMPGKTRHFQTLILDDSITLCDCPGLVFPTFMNSQADLVCNGIIPIDRLRDYLLPCDLVARRVDKRQFANLYGLRFADLESRASSSEILVEFARVRGLVTGRGLPDEANAARHILKDFTNGRLLYCHPPPQSDHERYLASLVLPNSHATRPDYAPMLPKPHIDSLLMSTLASTRPGAAPTKGAKKAMKGTRARMKAFIRSGESSELAKRKAAAQGAKPTGVIAVANYNHEV